MKNKLYLMALLFSLMGCEVDKPDNKSQALRQVAIKQVEAVNLQKPVRTVGTIQADKNLKLSFKIGGIIDRIKVETGDQVAEGEPLAYLNTVEIDSRLKQARLALEKANRDFERVNNLYNDSVATLEQWQNAQTALEVARADLEMTRFNRRYAVIKAPREGILLKKLAQPGEIIGAGYPVLVLGTTEKQHRIVAQVTDREWVLLQKGDSATVSLDAHPGKNFPARIEQISPVAEKYTGTYETKLVFTKATLPLTTGMIGRVKIFPGKQQPYFKIPVDGLVEASGKQGHVYVVKNGKAAYRSVQIDRTDKKNMYIKSGLNKGDSVITKGKSFVSAGEPVKIIEKD